MFSKVKIQSGQSRVVENLTLLLYKINMATQWVTSNVLLFGIFSSSFKMPLQTGFHSNSQVLFIPAEEFCCYFYICP